MPHHRARYRGASERIKAERKLESTLCGQSYDKKGKARAMLTIPVFLALLIVTQAKRKVRKWLGKPVN